MQIIPVIDLMGGCVVHAKRGRRDDYRPIQTPLCPGSSPEAVIDALIGLHGFQTLYVADLDALTEKGNHDGLLSRLQHDYSGLQFWIDRGVPPVGNPCIELKGTRVVGSESLRGISHRILPSLGNNFVLSLDFMGEILLGESSLLKDSSLWPSRVIIMSLSRVGADEGPDFRRLSQFRTRWPEINFIVAGGVRHAKDLLRLEDLGCGGVLLASALHSGAIDPSVLRIFE